MANILVYIELVDDQASWASLLTLRLGRQLATRLGATLYGVLPCASPPLYGDNDIIAVLSRQGADKVILMTHTALATPALFRGHGDALLTAATQFPPALLLFPAGPSSTDIAPRVATRLGALFVNQPRLEVDEERHLVIHQPAYNRTHIRRFSTSDLEHSVVAVVAPDPQGYTTAQGSEEAEVVVISPGFKEARSEAEPVTRQSEPGALTERVVLVGTGLEGAEAWKAARHLADRLDADLRQTPRSAERDEASDVPVLASRHTGALPGLVLALGVSGSDGLLDRLPRTSYLVAVHTDRDAPIFKRAHLALEAPPHQAIKDMIEEAGERPQPSAPMDVNATTPPPVVRGGAPALTVDLGRADTMKVSRQRTPILADDDDSAPATAEPDSTPEPEETP